ncbi:MAG TPA: hypothetical protein VK963_02710, partial [Candidatus Saccharimonadales bacterium]|nr:hypothetical protein [Candidatus Saccharimonadales bacterium]
MQLQPNLWLEGPYYVDFDPLGQLRVVGPNNHLYFGSVGLGREQIRIDSVETRHGKLVMRGRLLAQAMFLHDPVVAHIQKVRHYTELAGKATPTFEAVVKKHSAQLLPNYIGLESTKAGYQVSYKRLYQRHWYGAKLTFAPDVQVHRQERRRGFALSAHEHPDIGFIITSDTDYRHHWALEQAIKAEPIDTAAFGTDQTKIKALLRRTEIEINHLVGSNKTSGFEYGTVFPRDWMESADLGALDLTPEAIHYIYHKAYEYVNPEGVGWHENIVGEFEFEKHQEASEVATSLDDLIDQSNRVSSALKELIGQVQEMYVIRSMVDIEPRYLLGLNHLTPQALDHVDLERLRKVARFIMVQAEGNNLITFKKMPVLLRRHKHDEYYAAGNWRDSRRAFQMVHPVIAPYDVNVVFYPLALEMIARHATELQVDQRQTEVLIKKWSRTKDWYRFTNRDGTSAYALALYDVEQVDGEVEFKKLEVNHTDEAYAAFYASPDEADVASFCRRLLDPGYFYTASGPMVVGAGDGYDTTDYHGQVIWTKQTAYVVAGLGRQLGLARERRFTPATIKLLQQATKRTAEASIRAFLELGAVPELHYDAGGHPRFYSDQPTAEGPMNLVQLW